jgi:hypothetical protein
MTQEVIDGNAVTWQRLTQVPHDETGLDTDRMARFLGRHGLAMKYLIGVDEEGKQDINEIMGWSREPTSTVASYFPLLGITYVLRGEFERTHSTRQVEAEGIHEIFHANGLLRFARGGKLIQNGFVILGPEGRRGDYYEEGSAEEKNHGYVIQELGMISGLLNRTEPLEVSGQVPGGPEVTYLLPGSYLYPGDKPTWFAWHKSAHAAFGMQLLIARDPDIQNAMLASRHHPDGLMEFEDRINQLDAGLHAALDTLPYNPASFMAGTRLIIDRLYDGDPESALSTALQQDSVQATVDIAA